MKYFKGFFVSTLASPMTKRKLLYNFPNLTNKFCQTSSLSAVDTKVKDSQPSDMRKKNQEHPFAKNLFLGKFDPDILTYPEVLDKERLQALEEKVLPIEKLFSEINSKEIDEIGSIRKEVLNKLSALNLFGQLVPKDYDGLGLNATEYSRVSECLALDGSIASMLSAHQDLGIKSLLLKGSDQQKKLYFPRLQNGELIAAFCLSEPKCGSDIISLQTKAELSEDGKFWTLTGKKIWVRNGALADLFIVFARTSPSSELHGNLTAFLVERKFGGVSNSVPIDKMGIRGCDICTVTFDNTEVPAENVLGSLNEGFALAMQVFNSGQYNLGSASSGILKKLMEMVTNHVINRNQYGKSISEFELIQEKLAKITCMMYAMESMTYLTAGIIDSYESPDYSLEASIVKVFSSENCWIGVNDCLQLLGSTGYSKDFSVERFLRDTRVALLTERSNEVVKMMIALVGLHHAGTALQGTVSKERNPLMNPGFIFSRLWSRRDHIKDDPKLILHLEHYLHPSLQHHAKLLEYCVLRLQYGVEAALVRHGSKITEKQMILRRLAEVVIDIYAMTAVLGRASRSYCIGLQDADVEVMLAGSVCYEAHSRVKKNILEIESAIPTADEYYLKIAELVLKNKGYFPQHALARNY